MKWGLIILLVLLMIQLVSAGSTTGKITLEISNPNYVEGDELKTPIEIAYETQQKAALENVENLLIEYTSQETVETQTQSNLITGNVISEEAASKETNYSDIMWFLGLIAIILLSYFIYLLVKLRK